MRKVLFSFWAAILVLIFQLSQADQLRLANYNETRTDTPDITNLINGQYVRIKAANNGKYFAARLEADMNNRWTVWRFVADTNDQNDPATKFYIKKLDANFIVLKSYIAGGNNLQVCPGGWGVPCHEYEARFWNQGEGDWEHMSLEGGSLASCWLKSRNKKYIIAERDVRTVGDLSLKPERAWATGEKDENSRLSIEIVSPTEFSPLKNFETVDFPVTQISIGNPSNIWGIGSDNSVYRLAQSPQKMAGELKQISSATDGTVWGISPQNEVLKWDGTKWAGIPTPVAMNQVAVGSRNNVWAISTSDSIHRWNGTQWVTIPGGLIQISIGSDGTVWGVSRNKDVYRWTVSQIEEGLVVPEFPGGIFGTMARGQWEMQQNIRRAQQTAAGNPPKLKDVSSWTKVAGGIDQVAVANANQIFGIKDNKPLWWDGGSFREILGAPQLKTIAAGNGLRAGELSVYGIGTDNKTYKGVPNNFGVSGKLTQISVATEDNIVGRGTNGIGYKYNRENNSWGQLSNIVLSQVEIGTDGTWAGVSSDNFLVINGNKTTHQIKRVSVLNASAIYAIGTNNLPYRTIDGGTSLDLIDGSTAIKDFCVNKQDGSLWAIDMNYILLKRGGSTWIKIRSVPLVSLSLGKNIVCGIGPTYELFIEKYITGGFISISAGQDGTIWAIDGYYNVVKIAKGQKDIAADTDAQNVLNNALSLESELSNYISKLEAFNKESDWDKKIEGYKGVKNKFLINQDYFVPLMNGLKNLVENRKATHLQKIQELLALFIDDVEFVRSTITRRGIEAAKEFSGLNQAQVEDALKTLKAYKDAAANPIDYTELLNRATKEFLALAEDAKAVQIGTPAYNKFVEQTGMWIARAQDLVTNMPQHPEASLNNLFVGQIQQQHLDQFSPWAIKLTPEQRTIVLDLVKKVKEFVPTPVTPVVVAPTPVVVEQLLVEKIITDFNDKVTVVQSRASMIKAIVEGADRDAWLKVGSDLAKEVVMLPFKPGLKDEEAAKITEDIKKLSEEPAVQQEKSIVQPTTQAQIDIKLVGGAHKPIRKIDMLSLSTTKALKAFQKFIDTTEVYLEVKNGKRIFRGNVKAIEDELTKWKTYYLTLANKFTNTIGTAISKEEPLIIWAAIVRFLVDNMANRSYEELDALWKLKQEATTYLDIMTPDMQRRFKASLDKIAQPPAAFEDAFKTAQTATELTGDNGKIKLYTNAIDKITADIPLVKRTDLIDSYINPFVQESLADTNVKQNAELLNSIIINVLNKANVILQGGLTEVDKATIAGKIAPLVELMAKARDTLIIQNDFATAEKETDITKKVELFTAATNKMTPNIPLETRIGIIDTNFKPLYTKALEDIQIKQNTPLLTSIKTLFTLGKTKLAANLTGEDKEKVEEMMTKLVNETNALMVPQAATEVKQTETKAAAPSVRPTPVQAKRPVRTTPQGTVRR